MVEGRLTNISKKFACLNKTFVKDPDQKVKQFVADQKVQLLNAFVRYEVGEGIEKREENFAEEVMNQVKK